MERDRRWNLELHVLCVCIYWIMSFQKIWNCLELLGNFEKQFQNSKIGVNLLERRKGRLRGLLHVAFWLKPDAHTLALYRGRVDVPSDCQAL